MNTFANNNKKYQRIIWVLSIAIPAAVAVLLFMPTSGKVWEGDVSFLPTLNAILNSCTALCLIAGGLAIKQKNEGLHRVLMMAGVMLSTLFLVSYVTYHSQGIHTYYGDFDANGIVTEAEKAQAGVLRYVYLVVLLTHIALAMVVLPLVLFAIYFAISEQRDKHKKIVKWAYPVWLYVAISGVLVYLMIQPFYPF